MKNIKNAIVAMFDSWQYNYTGCYGNDWIKTPNYDRFAREGVLFENCYGNNMPTLPVRRSMMTGRFGLQEIGWGPLRPEDSTIADLCWGSGVDTAIAYNSTVLFMGKGSYARSYATAVFSRGFDHFHFINDELYTYYNVDQFLDDPGFIERLHSLPDGELIDKINREEIDLYLRDKQYWKTEEDQTVVVNIKEAIKIIEERDKFHGLHLWIDCWDPHEPWDPPSVWDPDMKCPYDPDYEGVDMWLPPMGPASIFTEPQMHHIRMLFAEKITLCDKWFGVLCDCIRKEGMWENTLLWLCSDHGEPLGNGEHGHGIVTKARPWPYEELVHVPLIIKYPGCPAGRRISAMVQDCDCAPTILDWLGIKIPARMQGKSLLPLMRGEVDKVRDFAIAGYYNFSWSIINEDWSFIHWLDKAESITNSEYRDKYYAAASAAFGSVGETQKYAVEDDDAKRKYEEAHELDNVPQWTCTPGAKAEVPTGDELYNKRTDPFQLNNVIDQYPDVAKDLLTKLVLYMEDLKAE